MRIKSWTKKMVTISMMLSACWISVGAADNTPPSEPVKLIFIHHSTGGNWLADANPDQPYGGLGTALMNNNYYVSATNYGWGPESIGDSTDIPNWPDWFTGSSSNETLSALYKESGQNVDDFGAWARLGTDPGGENTIVMFKSCFPNSDLYGDPNDAAATEIDDQYTVSNAKAVYNNLLAYFQTRADKLFIVITAPPQNESDYYSDPYQTPASRSANARSFNNWLVDDWLDDYPGNNVAVFDYYNVLTGTDNHHRWQNGAIEHVINTNYNYSAYPTSEWDSHPNTTGQQKATAEFVDLLNCFYNAWLDGGSQPPVNNSGFDYQSYLEINPDLPDTWGMSNCIFHYVNFGYWEGRAVAFNTQEYLDANPDLPDNWSQTEAINHYNYYGKSEGRILAFDAGEYTGLYEDLPDNWSDQQAYSHYMLYGRSEGRLASFDEQAYLDMYPDLPDTWGQTEAFYHYLLYGQYENRVYDPYDESVFD